MEKGYCVAERRKRNFADFKLRTVRTKKGRIISMHCGHCATCGNKMCKIIANKKDTKKRLVKKKTIKKIVKKK